jgi:hypothetical protein
MPMDTLVVDNPPVIVESDPNDRVNSELRPARGMLWAVVAGGALWCVIGSAIWFGFR